MHTINSNNQNCIISNLFTQFCVTENITISSKMPDIEQIISCVIDPEIMSIKTINTTQGLSYEGQYLTGKKLVLELKLKQKILYVADFCTQSVHVIENEFYQSAYIVVPHKIEGTTIDYLIKNNFLKTKIILENINCTQIDKRNIFKNIYIRIQLLKIPTYEICYSFHENCTQSNVFMIYNSGTNNIRINPNIPYMSIKPRWSPVGNQIAFLSNINGHWMLYLYCLQSNTTRLLTDSNEFKSITGFCWSTDGRTLVITAYDGDSKELYLIEVNRKHDMQLTYGNKIYNSHTPKCSPDGKKIAFIRSFSNMNDLWVMDISGRNCKQITSNGCIASFEWSCDSINIAYISNIDLKPNTLFVVDTQNGSICSIECSINLPIKKKVKYSTDGLFLAFIGSDLETDNIYVYNIDQNAFSNVTCFTNSEKISDMTWNMDGSMIYYSVNELFHYNIYSIDLKTRNKLQITFTTASNIELDYRPRIS